MSLMCTTMSGCAGALSAQDIFEKEARSRKIVSFCQELDTALGGGVATGQVAEFCEPLSAAVAVHLTVTARHANRLAMALLKCMFDGPKLACSLTGGVPAVGKTQLG